MKDEYTTVFYDLVQETQSTTGYELPLEVEAYVVMLLADKLDKPNFLPQKSFAEAYLSLKQPYRLSAKELGDTCLFVTGVFPEYGLSVDYYSNIGKSSYSVATTNFDIEIFELLSTKFDFVREFINIATKPKYSPVLSIR